MVGATFCGAAVQKPSTSVRDSVKGNVKVSCFTCGAFYYTSSYQIRQGTHPCRCGAGPMIPARMEVCGILRPDMLETHPDYAAAIDKANRSVASRARRELKGGGMGQHKNQCGGCYMRIPHPRYECSCGFDNGAQAYREGAAWCPEAKMDARW